MRALATQLLALSGRSAECQAVNDSYVLFNNDARCHAGLARIIACTKPSEYLIDLVWIAIGWEHALPIPFKFFQSSALFEFINAARRRRGLPDLSWSLFTNDIVGSRNGLRLHHEKPPIVFSYEPEGTGASRKKALIEIHWRLFPRLFKNAKKCRHQCDKHLAADVKFSDRES